MRTVRVHSRRWRNAEPTESALSELASKAARVLFLGAFVAVLALGFGYVSALHQPPAPTACESHGKGGLSCPVGN